MEQDNLSHLSDHTIILDTRTKLSIFQTLISNFTRWRAFDVVAVKIFSSSFPPSRFARNCVADIYKFISGSIMAASVVVFLRKVYCGFSAKKKLWCRSEREIIEFSDFSLSRRVGRRMAITHRQSHKWNPESARKSTQWWKLKVCHIELKEENQFFMKITLDFLSLGRLICSLKFWDFSRKFRLVAAFMLGNLLNLPRTFFFVLASKTCW